MNPGGSVPGERHEHGLLIFVESIRWLGVRWGAASTARGLRQAGFRGRFVYWQWHAAWRGWLVLPALMDSGLLEREARRLADFISEQRQADPGRPIWLIGYSAGGYVATRALELLDDGVRVEAAAMLHAAFSPRRNLRPACRHLRRALVVCSSLADCLIVGLGTLLFGTADRERTVSIGMVGPRGTSADSPSVRSIRWDPSMTRYGYWGSHFCVSSAGYIRHVLAPAMGIPPGKIG